MCLVAVLVPSAAVADQGDFDTSFGANGYVQFDLSNGGNDQYSEIVVDGSGRLVATTHSSPAPSFVVRHLADGSLDTTFGTNGVTAANTDWHFQGLALDSSGRILASGHYYGEGGSFGIVRYTANGVIDTSFGTDGFVITEIPPVEFSDMNWGLILDASEKIILSGACGTASAYVLCLARYTPDGTLDTSFGTSGYVYTDLPGWGYDIVIDGSGNLLATTYTVNRLGVARFTPDGTLDTSFGANGVAETDVPGSSENYSFDLVLQESNNVIVGGFCYLDGKYQSCKARFTSDGILDTSFGTNGIIVEQPYSSAPTLIVDDYDRLLHAGYSCGPTPSPDYKNICISRHTADGVLDTTFSVDGVAKFDHEWRMAHIIGATFDGLGNVILAINCMDEGQNDFDMCLMKLKNASTPDVPTDVVVTAGSSQVTVIWNAPNDDGDNDITEYTATASPGGATCTTATTSCTIAGLTNGTAYTVTVFATNGQGDSEISPAYGPATPDVEDQPGYTG